MKFQRSIKHKTVILFASFTFLLALIYSMFTFLFAYIVEDEVIDNLLAKETAYLTQRFAQTGEFPVSRLDFMQHYPNTEALPDFIEKVLNEHPDATEVFTQGRDHFHISRLNLGGRNTVVNSDFDSILVADVGDLLSVTNLSGDMMLLMAGVMCVVMLLAIWLAYRIASFATKPILQLTHELLAQQNSDQSLSLSSKNDTDELGYLAGVIETSLNNLNAALQRESDFTRDVSHELRTPLTVLKNTLALIEQRSWQPEDKNRLEHSATQMQSTLSILLALARQESLETATLPIRPIFETCILALHQKLKDKGFTVNLDIHEDCLVVGNHSLIVLLVNNLIENAIHHASNASLSISRQDKSFVFENKHLKEVQCDLTEVNVKAPESQGFGQGLYLVRRIATCLNWQLRVETLGQSFKVILLPNGPFDSKSAK